LSSQFSKTIWETEQKQISPRSWLYYFSVLSSCWTSKQQVWVYPNQASCLGARVTSLETHWGKVVKIKGTKGISFKEQHIWIHVIKQNQHEAVNRKDSVRTSKMSEKRPIPRQIWLKYLTLMTKERIT
jgi:hypothetical protein